MNLEVIILAAGKGTRMKSDLPKVLHQVGGRPMLAHVIKAAQALNPKTIHIVSGYGEDRIRPRITEPDTLMLNWVTQEEQLGTGHAVQQAATALNDNSIVLVLYGDVPLIRADTLQPVVEQAISGDCLTLLTAVMDDASGYGRIIRDDLDNVVGIAEEKDCTQEQLSIPETNTGILAAPAGQLKGWLSRLDNDNAQGEYYLTDIVSLGHGDAVPIKAIEIESVIDSMGVNDLLDLVHVERMYQQRRASEFLDTGVLIMDPTRVDLRGDIEIGPGSRLDINVIIEGPTALGENVSIGANTSIKNSVIGAGSSIMENCVIEDAEIGPNSSIGPFARLRPGARLGTGVKVGNFVEIKNSSLGDGVKANHLSYIGDASIGESTNIGAGVITCNYDGADKHHTGIGKNVFIGSDVQFVAPVDVGDNATVGAGSTITSDVPEGSLAISRSRQRTLSGWKRPKKKTSD